MFLLEGLVCKGVWFTGLTYVCVLHTGEDTSLPKDQMKELQEVLTSSFFKSVKEVCMYLHVCL